MFDSFATWFFQSWVFEEKNVYGNFCIFRCHVQADLTLLHENSWELQYCWRLAFKCATLLFASSCKKNLLQHEKSLFRHGKKSIDDFISLLHISCDFPWLLETMLDKRNLRCGFFERFAKDFLILPMIEEKTRCFADRKEYHALLFVSREVITEHLECDINIYYFFVTGAKKKLDRVPEILWRGN